MSLDVWFPLAIYYVDLPEGEQRNPALIEQIAALQETAAKRRTLPTASWTGDVHNVDRLHLDPGFDWLTEQVGIHALEYLKTLGHDLSKIDLYIQRSWPVVARKNERIARHTHPTAHLSAVYYVAVPKDGAAGKTRFFNDQRPNEVSPGIGSDMTNGYSQHNALNFGSADYSPTAGRLLLFPAKQPHDVEPNETDEARISISYDLVITSRGGAGDGHHEFLMPPPSAWRPVGRSASDMLAPPPPPAAAEGRALLAEVSSQARGIDAFAIPEAAGHLLWESSSFADTSSPAAWAEYSRLLAEVPDEDWLRDHSGAVELSQACQDWRVYRDAVDRLYVHLQHRNVPLDGANLTAPVLQRRLAGATSPYQRGKAHLCVYVRIDHDGGEDCMLEFAEGGTVPLAPGTMVIASGFRRQRVSGSGHLIHFQLDLPAIARAEALQSLSLQGADVLDSVVFAAITAQPVNRALPPAEALFEKLRWLDARARRRDRHQACCAVRRFLVEGADPASASEAELELIRGHGIPAETPGNTEGRLIEEAATLSADQCEALRRFAEAHMTCVVPDSVDDLPEYQVNLSLETLSGLVGKDKLAALLKMPEALGAPADLAAGDLYERIEIFLRIYSPQTRPYIAFHSDTCTYTVNIALNDDDSVEGGKLLALNDAALTALPRAEGTAILHAGNLVHGVTKIEKGTRFSLILFFYRNANAVGRREIAPA